MRKQEIAARRIVALLMAVIGGVVFYFDEGVVATLLWFAVVWAGYALATFVVKKGTF